MQRSKRPSGDIITTLAASLFVALTLHATAAEDSSSNRAVVVHADGSVVGQGHIVLQPGDTKVRRITLDLGLPRQSPERRWLEDDRLPICHTQWEKNGIRYTQTVLVTRLGGGPLSASVEMSGDAVVMVQVMGENAASEYAEATAGLKIEMDGETVNLELRDGLVYSAETNSTVLLAAIDIPSSGIATTNGPQLQFQGDMPPGNAGAMTLKFPATSPRGEDEVNRLRDLQFSEEFRRVKRWWQNRRDDPAIPLGFSNPNHGRKTAYH